MSGKKVLVLGGGIGGVVASNLIRKHLGREHEVILVDRSAAHWFQPSYLWVMSGSRTLTDIQRPLSRLKRKGIKFVNEEVMAIRPSQKVILTSTGEIAYDYLVISLGASTDQSALPGAKGKNIFNLYDKDQLPEIERVLRGMGVGKLAVMVSSVPFKCPAAPYEAALLARDLLDTKGSSGVDISIYTPEPLPMPTAGPEIGNAVKNMIENRGILYFPQHKVKEIDPEKNQIIFESQDPASFDVLLMIPPHKAPKVLADSGLLAENGWVKVDKHTLETEHADVYAIGDNVGIKLVQQPFLPKAGVFAEKQATVVAQNIVNKISGLPATAQFDGHGSCFLEIGHGKAGFASGNFYAEPLPAVNMRRPGRLWHWAKLGFEKYWFRKWL